MEVVTGSGAIVAVKYDGGILLASDMGICYGSMYKFANVSHFEILNSGAVIGATGEFADFQALLDIVKATLLEEQCRRFGGQLTPKEIHTYIKRIMYQRRSNMKPFAIRVVLAGKNPDNSLYLGVTDPYGTTWEDDVICTGYSNHLKGMQLDKTAKKSKDEVRDAITQSFRALYARLSTMNGPVEFVDVSNSGIAKEEPVRIEANWEMIEEVYPNAI